MHRILVMAAALALTGAAYAQTTAPKDMPPQKAAPATPATPAAGPGTAATPATPAMPASPGKGTPEKKREHQADPKKEMKKGEGKRSEGKGQTEKGGPRP